MECEAQSLVSSVWLCRDVRVRMGQERLRPAELDSHVCSPAAQEAAAAVADTVPRYRSADLQTLEELASEHSKLVYRLIVRLVGSGPDVEDLMQDVMVAAVASAERREPDTDMTAWIYGITLNVCRNYLRRRRYRRLLFWRYQNLAVDGGLASEASPPSRVEAQEEADAVHAAVQRLKAPQREAVILHYWEDLSVAQVAAASGVPVGTVKSRLHHARRKLRRMLGPILAADEVEGGRE